MDTIYRRCGGLDVHKETVQACVRIMDDSGRTRQEVRGFGTTTRELLALYDWLHEQQVTHVAMESTGVYWKPVWNILESGFELLLANARHIKNVPGRKTDVKDCQWIAQLMQCGLLKPSFVPRTQQRQWRDLTRHRVQIVAQITQTANRIQKILEDANIKLSSVATDVLGVSGREIIRLMIQGVDDPLTLAACARGRLKSKTAQLREALQGKLSEHHRFMLQIMMDQLEQLETLVKRIEDRLDESMKAYASQIELLDTIPGVDKHVAQTILAEIGADMSHFPTDQALACWAGMCPGNDLSANKRRSGRTVSANRWLRRALVQAGWAASHTKNTYLSAQYHRLVSRRGKKRALMAAGHSILVSAYHMLKNGQAYRDLGSDHFQQREPNRLIRQLVRRLQSLGQNVTLSPAA
jgi:transposase